MFLVHERSTAILLCLLTMIGWGSWANTQKLAGREKWTFELFYWDYSIGVALTGLLFWLTLGSSISGAPGGGTGGAQARAFGSGALFNLANILFVAAIDSAGLAVAFPVAIGLALALGTALSYIEQPKGNAVLIFIGVMSILAAMVVSMVIHNRLPQQKEGRRRSGLLFAIAAGVLTGFFYPQLMRAISPGFTSGALAPGFLSPYGAVLWFGIGVLVSSLPINAMFMRSRGSRFSDYVGARPWLHVPGLLGGAIWMIALGLNVIASGVAGPAISYALGQGATLIAALWGVFIWKEFAAAPRGTKPLIGLMFAAYAIGLVLIGMASQSS